MNKSTYNGDVSTIRSARSANSSLENTVTSAHMRDAESRMKFALNAAEMGDWELDLVTGKAYRSLKHDQCFGYSELQSSWSLEDALRHIHPDDRDMVKQAHLGAASGNSDMKLECRVIWADGSLHWITSRARVEKDDNGKSIRLAGLVWDITEEKLASEAAKEGEARFRQLADSMPQLAWIAHADGFIHWYNKGWYDYSGTTSEQMKGWGWQSVHDPKELPRVLKIWKSSIETGKPFELEFPLKNKQGTYRWFLTRASPIRDSTGKIERWIGTNTDIDAQKKAEHKVEELALSLKKSVQIRDEFMSVASHELKTPITAIKMQIQVGQKSTDIKTGKIPTAERLTKIFEVSGRQIDRLNGLVDNLLDVSRIEAGKLNYNIEEVNLSELVREVAERFEDIAAAAHSNISLIIDCEVVGEWDRLRIEQVITNLLSNAIKYGSGNPIAVHLGKDRDKTATLSVKDHGLGIEKENLSKIFDRFERANSAANIGGLGLGLYITRSIVNGHCGDITVQSELGQGSTFTVSLPLHPEKSSQ